MRAAGGPRRALQAAVGVTFLLLPFLGAVTVGLWLVGSIPPPARAAADAFEVPLPRPGDRGIYGAHVTNPMAPQAFLPTPGIGFEWMEPRLSRDAEGRTRWADVVRAGEPLYAEGPQPRFELHFDHDDGTLLNFVKPSIGLSSDASHAPDGGQAHAVEDRWFLPEWGLRGLAPCPLRGLFQGQTVGGDQDQLLFASCSLGDQWIDRAWFRLHARDELEGLPAVVLASTRLEPSSVGTVYLWMAPNVPFPLLIVHQAPGSAAREVARLAYYEAGAAAPEPARPAPEPAAPALDWAPAPPWGVPDEAAAWRFHPSDAFERAREHAGAQTLREFLALHETAWTRYARWDVRSEAYGSLRTESWGFVLTDGQAEYAFRIARRDPTPLAHVATASPPLDGSAPLLPYEFLELAPHPDAPSERAAPLASDRPPVRAPTVGSALGRWAVYDPELVQDEGRINFEYRYGCLPPVCERLVHDFSAAWLHQGDALPLPGLLDDGPQFARGGIQYDSTGATRMTWRVATPALTLHLPPTEFVREKTALDEAVGVRGDASMTTLPWRVPPASVALAAGLVAALVVAALGLRSVLRGGLTLLGYSRLVQSRALAQPVRSLLVDLVRQHPGLHFQELVRCSGRSPSTVDHHLRLLVRLGLVVRVEGTRYVCFFPKGRLGHPAMTALPVLKSRGARRVLDALVRSPGTSPAELARGVGASRQGVHRHLVRMEACGLVSFERRDGRVRVVPTGLGREVAADPPGPPSGAPAGSSAAPTDP